LDRPPIQRAEAINFKEFMNDTTVETNVPTLPLEAKTDGLLRKVRSDAKWKGLSKEQCERLEEWLFEDNISYKTVAKRLKGEFGLEASKASVGRFYRHRAKVRQGMELLEAQVASDNLGVMPARTEDLRETTVKLLAKKALRLAMEQPEEQDELLQVMRLLLASEENEIRLRRVRLGEREHDFAANTACAKELQKVRSYLRTVAENESLTEEEKHGRALKLLFGRETVPVEETNGEPAGATQMR
jgi:hypothetical protein